MWSAFPTPSTETSADGVNTEVHDVHKCGDSSPGGGEPGTARGVERLGLLGVLGRLCVHRAVELVGR